MIKLQSILLREFNEKTIKDTLIRWGIDPNDKSKSEPVRQLINRFDQIKGSLSQKLQIVSLSDELKNNNNYLNIDKYSYDDMIKLIRSLPEDIEKIKKEAVKNFVDKDGIDKPTAQSYVARFINKKNDLKYAVENGTEDGHYDKEEVKGFIPDRLLINNMYLDPRMWRWDNFEQTLDALFPSQGKHIEGEENIASTDADKVYDQNNLEIYRGDEIHKCISYNPVVKDTNRKKYGWCVTQIGNTNYNYYRFGEESPTFYFVFDRDKTSTPNHARFDDKWHAIVIQVTYKEDPKDRKYIVTNANNDGDSTSPNWNGISEIVPPEIWNKIKNLQDIFKPIKLSSVELAAKFASGKNLNVNEFKDLSQDEKILYIQGKAKDSKLTHDILSILSKYKINLEGRTTTLANVAIDSGQKFSYSDLKDNESLAKRYAIFRFRHTDYSKEPIPLPFVKYLDDAAKEKYLKTFNNDNLTFEYIIKYFGEKAARDYINEISKDLFFIPKEAIDYIDDINLRNFYKMFSKLYQNWLYSSVTNLNDEEIEKESSMPTARIDVSAITYDQWKNINNQEKNSILLLAEKTDKNPEKYEIVLYSLPYIIKDKGKIYFLLPTEENKRIYENWVLIDENNNIIKKIDGNISQIGENELLSGYPIDEPKRIYNLSDLKIDNNPVVINEIKRLQTLAGII